MKKYLTIFFALVHSLLLVNGQDDFNTEIKVIPASPSVADIGKYGLTKAGLSDGGFSKQIPLYTYQTKNLSLPIFLSYNTNGLKVDKIASRVGMDWSLNVGGSIGRMVLGDPDEYKTWVNYPSDFPATSGTTLWNLILSVTEGSVESVPDIYTLNLNGITGRFLCINQNIIKLEQNSLDIQLLGSSITSGFQVTDNQGVKYFFTRSESSRSSSTCANHPYSQSQDIITSWLLTKIVHPYQDIINITYKPVTSTYSTGVNQTAVVPPLFEHACPTHDCPIYPQFTTCVSSIQNNGWLVDKIYSNFRGVVQFSYSPRIDIPEDSKLEEIQVLDATCDGFGNLTPYSANPIKTISFDYTYPESNSLFDNDIYGTVAVNLRMYLTTIIESSSLSSQNDATYAFNYNDLDNLPPRLSFAQDHFGFFNGKSGNRSLIPEPTDTRDYNYLQSYGFGDRNPDWRYASKGLLSKITYPTGGYDLIEYEANNVYRAGFNCTNPDSRPEISVTGTSDLHQVDYFYSDPFTVNCPQVVDLLIEKNCDLAYPISSYYSGACIESYDVTYPQNSECVISTDLYGRTLGVGAQESSTFKISLSQGTYRLKLKEQGPGFGHASFSYYNSQYHDGNVDVPGVRVAKIITYSKSNLTPVQTCYHYTDDFTTKSSGENYLESPIYSKQLTHTISCFNGQLSCAPVQCNYSQYTSDNFCNLYSYSGNNIYYRDVSEYNGIQGENGVIEHKFLVSHDAMGVPINGTEYKGAPLINSGIYNGHEYNTRFYKYNFNNNFTLSKEIITHEKYDERLQADHTFYGFQEEPGITACANGNSMGNILSLDVVKFDLLSVWKYADVITEKIYEPSGTIINTVTKTYDNAVHQLPTIISKENSKGEDIVEKNYYPGDEFSISDPNASAARESLLTNHMYPLLKRQVYNNSTLLEEDNNYYSNTLYSQATIPYLYQNWQKISNENHLKNQIEQVGNFGNILQLKQTSQPTVCYIWDYFEKVPIAEVINASQSEVAYTSFEADGSGNWLFSGNIVTDLSSPTGNKCYNLSSGSISKSGLNSSKIYTISLWAKVAPTVTNSSLVKTITGLEGWKYYEYKTNTSASSVTISGNTSIDELRLFPEKAQMKTFTYQPLIGITSQTDFTNHTNYYEYDAFNRLSLIRDQNKNILKSFKYKLGTYSNELAQWIPTGQLRCKPCSSNPAYLTNIQQHEERDIGPGSPTNNTTIWVDDGISTSCSANAVWQNTSDPVYCKKTSAGNNTGKLIQLQVDVNSCSLTYNQTREFIVSTDVTACPLTVCSGEDTKLINYDCEIGTKVYTSSFWRAGNWICTYHYIWSDGSISSDHQETSTYDCMLL